MIRSAMRVLNKVEDKIKARAIAGNMTHSIGSDLRLKKQGKGSNQKIF